VCVEVPGCSSSSGRKGGERQGECKPCEMSSECGWFQDKKFCWPDGECREIPPYIAYFSRFEEPEHTQNKFRDGDAICLTIALNVEDPLLRSLFTIEIISLEECAIHRNINPMWYGKHTLHGAYAPYGIAPFNSKSPRKTGCYTPDDRIHKKAIFNKKREVLLDKDKLTTTPYLKPFGIESVETTQALVYFDQKHFDHMKDHPLEKRHLQEGVKIVFESMPSEFDNDDPTKEIGGPTSTMCWQENAISPKDIPVYFQADIEIHPKDLKRVNLPAWKNTWNVTLTTEELKKMYVDTASAFGVMKLDSVALEMVGDASVATSSAFLNSHRDKLSDMEKDGHVHYGGIATVPISEFSSTWVECLKHTGFDETTARCESPNVDKELNVWILILSGIVLVMVSAYVIFAAMYS